MTKFHSSIFEDKQYFYNVNTSGGYLNCIIADNPQERFLEFETAEKFMNYVKLNKIYDSTDFGFCTESTNKYFTYEEILASPKLLKDIKHVKRKSDHLILWSKFSQTFDTRISLI